MVILWRKLVIWLRAILLKVSKKEKIEWIKEIITLLGIIVGMLENQPPIPEPKPEPKKPKIPDYNIIPTPKPKRRLLDWLLRR